MKVLVAILLPVLAVAKPIEPRHDTTNTSTSTTTSSTAVNTTSTETKDTGLPTTTLPTVNLPTPTLPTVKLPTANPLPTGFFPTTNFADKRGVAPTGAAKRAAQVEEIPVDDGTEDSLPMLPGHEFSEWEEKIKQYSGKLCGGYSIDPPRCDEGEVCIDAPWFGCGMACDAPGICVDPAPCGGIAGLRCPHKDDICIDYPNDGCSDKTGGRDCPGICI